MSKSLLYANNATTQAIVAGGSTVNFGTPIRRYGCNCNISGGNVEIDGAGYYDVDVNITAEFTTAGTEIIQILKDGVAVPGAIATITTVADGTTAITIPAVIRQICCCPATITVSASGVAGNITNASIVVEKV